MIENILYLVDRSLLDNTIMNLRRKASRYRWADRKRYMQLSWRRDPQSKEHTYRFFFAGNSMQAQELLAHNYFGLMIIDNHHARETDRHDFQDGRAARFLRFHHDNTPPEQRFRFDRILVIMEEEENLNRNIFELGRFRVSGFITDPFGQGDIFERIGTLLRRLTPGKAALCLAGGGIEGMLYELGVLRALDSFLIGKGLIDFDIFCGISAGSILASFLANGVPPDIIERGMRGGIRGIKPVKRGMLFDIHFYEYLSRVGKLAWRIFGIGGEGGVEALAQAVPPGFFWGRKLGDYMEGQLNRENLYNSFDQLEKELYIGATDQDNFKHVVFGEPDFRDVPISQAVSASSALTPFYEPVKVGDRWYIDGGFSRTSNVSVALAHGARLVIIIDPLVPILSEKPGFVRKRGGIFGGIQGLKSMIHTRFTQALSGIMEQYPYVDFFIFQPDGEIRRAMSGSLMKYWFRTNIEQLAFSDTRRRIRLELEKYHREFKRHGFELRDHEGDNQAINECL